MLWDFTNQKCSVLQAHKFLYLSPTPQNRDFMVGK